MKVRTFNLNTPSASLQPISVTEFLSPQPEALEVRYHNLIFRLYHQLICLSTEKLVPHGRLELPCETYQVPILPIDLKRRYSTVQRDLIPYHYQGGQHFRTLPYIQMVPAVGFEPTLYGF